MSLGIGPHDLDCPCERCASRRGPLGRVRSYSKRKEIGCKSPEPQGKPLRGPFLGGSGLFPMISLDQRVRAAKVKLAIIAAIVGYLVIRHWLTGAAILN